MPADLVVLVAFAASLCAAAVAVGLLLAHNRELRERAVRAERRFDLLQQLAPALTAASTESATATCVRIVERLRLLVASKLTLCFVARDGGLVLGAKAGEGYVDFLRVGSGYRGTSVVDWAFDNAEAALVGPGGNTTGALGPVAGSKQNVWALAVPLLSSRGVRLRPEVLGVIYLERTRAHPFSTEDVSLAKTVARLAADALARAIFADAVRRDADVDGLTELMTPAAFRRRLRDEVAGKRDVALLFIDTDHFKPFNDAYGHTAGDRLLRRLAALFESTAKNGSGFAGRNGGDEFCIALLDRTKDSGIVVAEHLRESIDALDLAAELGFARRVTIKITVSIGVAHAPVDVPGERQAADKLLEIADAQMYEAKRAGRNRVEFLRLRAFRRAGYPGEGPIPRV